MERKPGSDTRGDIEAVVLVGPKQPATKTGRVGFFFLNCTTAAFAQWAAAVDVTDLRFEFVVSLRDQGH